MSTPKLEFYRQPFHKDKYLGWVYDANGNFVFEFEPKYTASGDYDPHYTLFVSSVIDIINDDSLKPIDGLVLTKSEEVELLNDGEPCITIRILILNSLLFSFN